MTEHPMTDATPLASEQITQEDREPCEDGQHCCCCGPGEPCCDCGEIMPDWHAKAKEFAEVALGNAMRIGELEIELIRANDRIAALSATPAPSDQDASQAQGEGALLAHVRKMQEACANYIEPTTYIARHPDTGKIGDCAWVREFPMPDQNASDHGKAEANARRDAAFIRDMIYMLDGPEQRAAMLPAPGATAQDGVDVDTLNLRAERAAGNIPSPTPTIPAGMVAYGPEHPDYPSEPKDWNKGALLFDNGKLFAAPAGHIWKLDWKHHGIIAYTPLAAAPKQAEQQGVERPYPELLSSDESSALLKQAEELWSDLQSNNIGGFSGVNRPFYILHEFRRVIETFGHRDTGLKWSKNDLDAAALNAPTGAVEKGEAK